MKIRKYFPETAKLIREKRELAGKSQTTLAYDLGYKNGQFISNAERGLSTFPAEKIPLIASVLDCTTAEIIMARITEEKLHLDSVVAKITIDDEKHDSVNLSLPLGI